MPEQKDILQKAQEEHINVLKFAKEAMDETDKNLQIGRQRLQNALKKYQERGKIGPSRLI